MTKELAQTILHHAPSWAKSVRISIDQETWIYTTNETDFSDLHVSLSSLKQWLK